MSGSGKVRIIAGQWRGRKIDVIHSSGLRPSTDRARETLFNWLKNHISASRCLDLFAGTGVLGFEALSRGAKEVTFVENKTKIVKQLRRQASQLKSKQHIIYQSDAVRWLKKQRCQFDLIFLDPPFNSDFINVCCRLINEKSLLHQAGMIYIESNKKLSLPLALETLKYMQIGQVNSALTKLKIKNGNSNIPGHI